MEPTEEPTSVPTSAKTPLIDPTATGDHNVLPDEETADVAESFDLEFAWALLSDDFEGEEESEDDDDDDVPHVSWIAYHNKSPSLLEQY